ncbi:hypothetical protein D3C78_1531930 [compost metagenome]
MRRRIGVLARGDLRRISLADRFELLGHVGNHATVALLRERLELLDIAEQPLELRRHFLGQLLDGSDQFSDFLVLRDQWFQLFLNHIEHPGQAVSQIVNANPCRLNPDNDLFETRHC